MIGIITIVKVNNYGAELQAFALQKKLELLGYRSEIIDYLYYKNWNFNDTAMSKPFISMGIKAKAVYWAKYRLVNFLLAKVFPVFNKSVRLRLLRFDGFHRRNTKFSRQYRSMPDLYNAKLDYDVFIVGSDQVWNPMASSSIEPYFLTFAPKGARKISYASSFGVSQIDKSLHERFRDLLNNIDVISVRETSGQDLVKQLTGRHAELVADPTLLLTKQEWGKYMAEYPSMPKRYVLIYQLSDSVAIVRLAKRIAEEKGIPVFRICKRAFGEHKDGGVTNILDAGPAEFLWLIAHAEYVVTNSFHGTAFSVNFNIPFFTVVSSTKKNNSRMESLLTAVDLRDRMQSDDIDISSIKLAVPDFSQTGKWLESIRQKSETFITNNLK